MPRDGAMQNPYIAGGRDAKLSDDDQPGWVAERFKAPVLKSAKGHPVSDVSFLFHPIPAQFA